METFIPCFQSFDLLENGRRLSRSDDQITWNATKRGVLATRVKSAYSSQECHVCHYLDRKNRPNQGTFHCRVCDHTAHADKNASQKIASRFGDQELRACQNRQEMKALLLRRHEQWKQNFSLDYNQAPVQLGLWSCSETSTDVG